MRTRRIFIAIMLFFVFIASLAQPQQDSFTLTILHTNDTHAHHVPNSDGTGGAARLATVVKEIRAESDNVLLLDAGDRFADRHTGTRFHEVHRGQDNVRIMNLLGYDAMTLGNHEFDDGDRILANFVTGLNFPVLTANVDYSASPILGDTGIAPYSILKVNGEQIGIIGLTDPEIPRRSHPGKELVFSAELVLIANFYAALLTDLGVNKIILITHIGLRADRELIPQLVNIDVVVGGDSHTLLSNQHQGAAGPYPMLFKNDAGARILYVQARSRNNYLGHLELEFDANGLVSSWNGDTIFIANSIVPDPEMQALIDELAAELDE